MINFLSLMSFYDNPSILLGAIVSGGVAGTHISPVSNTNVTATAIMNCDVFEFYLLCKIYLKEFEKFGETVKDRRLKKDDDASVALDFIFRFKFFDRYYANLFITNNGVCYFDSLNAIIHPQPKPFPIAG